MCKGVGGGRKRRGIVVFVFRVSANQSNCRLFIKGEEVKAFFLRLGGGGSALSIAFSQHMVGEESTLALFTFAVDRQHFSIIHFSLAHSHLAGG